MPEARDNKERIVRDRAYHIWEREGRPDGRAHDHWHRAISEVFRAEPRPGEDPMLDEEKILAGRLDVNMPALLTRDVPGG